MLEAKKLVKSFCLGEVKERIIDNVNLTIEDGEFVAIMGPSGAGKSTLLHLISGLLRPDEGEVLIDDNKIYSLNDKEIAELRASRIGIIFQDYNIIEELTVVENIKLPLIIAKREIDIDAINRILKDVGLIDKAKKMCGLLSGGERQRVAIARTMCMNPTILFADEPTGNLDSKNHINIMELLKKMNEEKNTTIVMVTHNDDNLEYFSRIINIRDGKIECELPEHSDNI